MENKTTVELLKDALDLEIKSGTKMIVNWDMYLQMEKDQIVEAHNARCLYGVYPPVSVQKKETYGEQYYNEKYGK